MKTKFLLGIIVLSFLGTVGISELKNISRNREFEEKSKALDEQLKVLKAKEEEDEKLGQYIINMMYMTSARTKLSDTMKQVRARAIVRVANDIFDSYEHKKAHVAVLAIESGFNHLAQSPTGPKGIGQMAKSAFKEGISMCISAGVNEDDVWDAEINLYASACYFKMLLERYNGDPYAAIVSYNQGANSDAAKSYTKSGNIDNIEALKYVAKFTFLKRNVTEEKKDGVPSLTELAQRTNKDE